MSGSEVNTHGILDMVSRVSGGPYYTISQVATQIDRSKDTIRRWVNQSGNEHLRPDHKMPLGDENDVDENGEPRKFVWLFTVEDVIAIKAYRDSLHPGRRSRIRVIH